MQETKFQDTLYDYFQVASKHGKYSYEYIYYELSILRSY